MRPGRLVSTFLLAGASPVIGVQLACIVVIWIVLPVSLLVSPALVQEHGAQLSVGALAVAEHLVSAVDIGHLADLGAAVDASIRLPGDTTGLAVAAGDMVVTDLAVFTIDKHGKDGMALIELADGVTLDEVKAKTEAEFRVALKNA